MLLIIQVFPFCGFQNKTKTNKGGGGGGPSEGFINTVKIWLYYIYWMNGSFAAKLSLMVDRHNPKCPVKMFDCYL